MNTSVFNITERWKVLTIEIQKTENNRIYFIINTTHGEIHTSAMFRKRYHSKLKREVEEISRIEAICHATRVALDNSELSGIRMSINRKLLSRYF